VSAVSSAADSLSIRQCPRPCRSARAWRCRTSRFVFFKQETAYDLGLGIPAEPLFRSRHNANFFSDKLVLTSVTPASSAPVLQTPKATSSTLYFDSLTVNAGNGGFLHCIQMDTSVNAANQVVSVGA